MQKKLPGHIKIWVIHSNRRKENNFFWGTSGIKTLNDKVRIDHKPQKEGTSIRVFLNSLNNPKFGASQNLKILIGIPPLDDPMTNLPKKNGWNSLQPPEMELQSLVPTESPSWHHISSRSPGHIHQRIWACHTSLERSRIAFYGYANLCPPNQTIWRLEASKAIQRCPWFAYIRRWDENFSHWVTSYTSLAFRKT